MAKQNDALKQFAEKLKANIQMVFVGVMVVLLLLRLSIYLAEENYRGEAEVRPQPKPPVVVLSPEKPEYQKVRTMIDPMGEFEKSPYASLVEFNMFDPKQVIQATELERRVRERLQQGWQAFYAKDYPKAREVAEECLKNLPNYLEAKELVRRIKVELGEPVEGEAPTTGSATAAQVEGGGGTPPPGAPGAPAVRQPGVPPGAPGARPPGAPPAPKR